MNHLIRFAFFIALSYSLPVFGQNGWSLDDCIKHAIEHNLLIKQMEQNSFVDRINLTQAKAMRWPNLSANVNAGRLDVLAAEEDLSILIAQHFLQILQLQEQIKNVELQVESSQEQLENIRSRYEQGLVAEHNIFQMEAQKLRKNGI